MIAAAPDGAPRGGSVTKNSKNSLPAVPRRGPEADGLVKIMILWFCRAIYCVSDNQHKILNSQKSGDPFSRDYKPNRDCLPKIVCDSGFYLSKRDRLGEHTQERIVKLPHLFINQG